MESGERFDHKAAKSQQRKMEQTSLMRAAEAEADVNVAALPVGQVVQVYSLFNDVEHEGRMLLCVIRKTLSKVTDTSIVVGDHVRFRETGVTDESGRPEAVIEAVLPRRSVLTRTDSFKATEQHPIVANADQMLIVVSVAEPDVKWGLVDRMLVAAQAGSLLPVVCLNKVDLAEKSPAARRAYDEALGVLDYLRSLDVAVLEASVTTGVGLEALRDVLRGKATVLAGHSGVGKSSLIRAIQPALDLRIGAISNYTGKGRHTTTSARRYPLDGGGQVIDTPGVKLFGLWGVTRENLDSFFPDVGRADVPEWRRTSYERIMASLPEPAY